MNSSFRRCKNPHCSELIPIESRKLFHSNACKMRDYRRRKSVHNKSVPTYIKHCLYCGHKFVTHYERRQFDSNGCRSSYWKQHKRLKALYPDDYKEHNNG